MIIVARKRCGGFTLVELLVVMVILGILGAAMAFALGRVREQARVTKTLGIIAWLDTALMNRWNSYETRRVPVNTANMAPVQAAQTRLQGVRELMRLELPETWKDMNTSPQTLPQGTVTTATRNYQKVWNTSKDRDGKLSSKHDDAKTFENAECLYLILTTRMGDAESVRELLKEGDIGDTDLDGFPEFRDGWGNPIMFFRWAPGFESPLQLPAELAGNPAGYQGYAQSNREVYKEYHDPHDPMMTDPRAFRLLPLIYSAGADQQYDLTRNDNPGAPNDPYDFTRGVPKDIEDAKLGKPDGELGHYDNIHNHVLETRGK